MTLHIIVFVLDTHRRHRRSLHYKLLSLNLCGDTLVTAQPGTQTNAAPSLLPSRASSSQPVEIEEAGLVRHRAPGALKQRRKLCTSVLSIGMLSTAHPTVKITSVRYRSSYRRSLDALCYDDLPPPPVSIPLLGVPRLPSFQAVSDGGRCCFGKQRMEGTTCRRPVVRDSGIRRNSGS